ncbi:MAG: hypothetical protein RLZZ148_1320 [Cyanobacteriota bacterium]|jgi:hypothetical protein
MTKSKIYRFLRPLLLGLAMFVWSLVGGWGISLALDSSPANVPDRFRAGLESYLETCAGCHVPIPPEVMPTQSWQKILQRPAQHYGVSVPLVRVTQVIVWQYLNFFSRPAGKEEPIPLYVSQSRFFKVLHPNVALPKPAGNRTCITCHPGALKFDYRTLSPEWESK